MATFSSLYRQIRLYAKSVPETTMDHAIRLAAREFCRKTWFVTKTITVDAAAGSAYYLIEPDDAVNQQIIGVKAMEEASGDFVLHPAKQEEVRFREGDPRFFIFLAPSTLELIPYPAADETDLKQYLCRIAITPTADCTELPDEIFPDFEQTIAYGAIQYICNIPGEGWSNDKVADEAGKRFMEGMRHAKSKAVFGHKPSGNRTSSPGFAI